MAILSLVLVDPRPVHAASPRRSASILGHIAKRQIAQTGEEGRGLATAGVIIGWAIAALYLHRRCGGS